MATKNRNDVDNKYKWRLEDIVSSDEQWESDFIALSSEIDKIAVYEEKLSSSNALDCLCLLDELGLKLERLYVYATMRHDEDGSVEKYNSMRGRIEMLSVKMSTLSAFVTPELVAIDETELLKLANSEKGRPFSYQIKEIVRSKPHVLTAKEEKLLAGVSGFAGDFRDIFGMFDNVDVKFGDVKVKDEKVTLTHATYSLLLQNEDKKVRRDAYVKMYTAYKNMINTISATYAGNVKKNAFYSKARNYQSTLSRALDGDDVAPAVYDTLIQSISDHTPYMHEYVALRKKALGVKTLNMYDMYVPIFEGANLAVSYEEACKIVKEALAPLGEEYGKLLDKAFNEGWIDVYENKGKRSGAYSWGTYGVHPYVLLNYTETTHDVFTIAHELGHAMHTHFSNEALPHACADYSIFVAEIASTVNEVLLIKHLLKTTKDRSLRKYLLSYYLDMFRTTVFRQTMFSEFEKFAHEVAERDEPLTVQLMSNYYLELNKKYYGKSVVHDEWISYEWARIPHFYRAFYVYKYSTGMISAVNIASAILEDGKNLDGYIKFLSAGGSMSPLDILKLANVDLTDKKAFEYALNDFKWALETLKSEME